MKIISDYSPLKESRLPWQRISLNRVKHRTHSRYRRTVKLLLKSFVVFTVCLSFSHCASKNPGTIHNELIKNDPATNTYIFHQPEAEKIALAIKASLESFPVHPAEADIDSVFSTFKEMDRGRMDRSDMVEIKFRMEHWRQVITKTLLE